MAINDVPVSCINTASIVYHVPVSIILSVMKNENGKNGEANRNKNGTIDYGVFQINSIWLPKIAAYGYTKNDIQYNPCKNLVVGVWILSQGIAEGKNIWQGIANFHSHTFVYNQKYQQHIYQNYRMISAIIGDN